MGNICFCCSEEPRLNGEAPTRESNNQLNNGNHHSKGSLNLNSQEQNMHAAQNTASNGIQPNFPEKNIQNGFFPHNGEECGSSLVTQILDESLYYKMDHPHRGIAIIFNHYKYKYNRLPPREGSHIDKKSLVTMFKKLNFEVHNHKDDLTHHQIATVLKKVGQANHADRDCLVVVVMTHGELNGCLSAFDIDYHFSALWEPFIDENCPSLKGKPRLFFVQACRGNKVMDAVELQYRPTQTDAVPYQTPVPNIPEHFYVAYATCEGYFSWRSETDGTWFIQTLCEQLEGNAYKHDLNFIMTRVLHGVATGYQSIVPQNISMDEKKQMPHVVTKLTRRLLFKEKQQENRPNKLS